MTSAERQSPQRRALRGIVDRIREVDPDAGIVLQGSVQHGTERPTSDLDLTVVLADRDDRPTNELITPAIRGRDDPRPLARSRGRGRRELAPLRGPAAPARRARRAGVVSLLPRRDRPRPGGMAAECQTFGRRWFAANPAVAEAWRRQNEEVRRAKLDPDHVLESPRWADFSVLLRRLVEPE